MTSCTSLSGRDRRPHPAAELLADQPGVPRAELEAVLGHLPARLRCRAGRGSRGAPTAIRGGVEPVRARRAGGHPLEERLERDQPGLDEVRVERRERRLEPGDAERRRLERHLLLVPRVRRVVGGDAGDRPVAERLDQRLAVVLGPERRVHLHVRVERADRLVGEHEMVRRDLRGRRALRRPCAPAQRSTDARAERCIRCSGGSS